VEVVGVAGESVVDVEGGRLACVAFAAVGDGGHVVVDEWEESG
jgi:hypothetical protein